MFARRSQPAGCQGSFPTSLRRPRTSRRAVVWALRAAARSVGEPSRRAALRAPSVEPISSVLSTSCPAATAGIIATPLRKSVQSVPPIAEMEVTTNSRAAVWNGCPRASRTSSPHRSPIRRCSFSGSSRSSSAARMALSAVARAFSAAVTSLPAAVSAACAPDRARQALACAAPVGSDAALLTWSCAASALRRALPTALPAVSRVACARFRSRSPWSSRPSVSSTSS